MILGGLFYFKTPSAKQNHICALNNDNIVTIGDSLANGFGVSEEDSFAIKTAKLLQKNPIKMGINGETTSELVGRIDSDLKNTPSITAVIISIGGNDFLQNKDKDTAKKKP